MRAALSIILLTAFALPAWADRPVTEVERAKLTPAVAAQGCIGGKLTWDEKDREFEVDDAMCGGRKHDLTFDREFRLTSKKLDE